MNLLHDMAPRRGFWRSLRRLLAVERELFLSHSSGSVCAIRGAIYSDHRGDTWMVTRVEDNLVRNDY